MQQAVKILGEFELYTEKEAFYNCAFLAALANGNTIIHNVKAQPEFLAFANYLKSLGASVNITESQWEIIGLNFKYEQPLNLDWVGNSFSYQKRNKKIIESLLNGVPFHCEEKIAVKDSLIRELLAFGAEVEWKQEGPDYSDELAKRMARMQGIKNERKWICNISPVPSLLARDRFIAGDVTEAAFLALAASLLHGSEITIKTVDLNPSRAGIFGAFKRLGANIDVISHHEKGSGVWGDLKVKSAKALAGRQLGADILAVCLDEIPMLAVLAAFAEEETIIKLPQYAVNFYKPILTALYENLKIAGIKCGLYEDGLILKGKSEIESDGFDCKGFPVLGLALHILNRKAKSKQEVKGIECAENMYPGILRSLDK
jgi:5-enolpyruvylshikimate-3-phosphate synthase